MAGLETSLESAPSTREDFVADALRKAILRGDLKPGERLDEKSVAETLKVSRTPVRSALRMLAAESLVHLQPHRGAVVNELSPDELEEICLVRAVLEGIAARLAAQNMDDERIANLESLLEAMEATSEPDRWLALNNRFHYTIYQVANGPRMLAIIDYVRNIALPYIRQYIADAEHMESSRLDHRRILAACRRRDGLAAEAEIQKHLQDVARALRKHVGAGVTSR